VKKEINKKTFLRNSRDAKINSVTTRRKAAYLNHAVNRSRGSRAVLKWTSLAAARLTRTFDDKAMITLVPIRLHWIKDDGADDPRDLCAHSPVRLQIDGDTLVDPEDGDETIIAAAIYLLRTLERDHTKENPVGDQLFPCCGHAMFDTGDDDVLICGCPNGSDVFVTRDDVGTIRLTSVAGKPYVVSANDWRQAIHEFSDVVRDFYDHPLPKTPKNSLG
jgi:hypothetical protein